MANNSLAAYRAQIGLFLCNVSKNNSKIKNWVYVLRSLNDIILVLTFIFLTLLIVSRYLVVTMFKMCLNGLFSTIFEENSPKLSNTFYAILIKFMTKNLMTNLLKIKSCVPNFLKQISKSASKISVSAFLSLTILSAIILAFFFSIKIAKFLVNCGDIESNPGFTFMQWNCNSLPAHDYTRVSLIEAYNTLHNFDLIALSETALRPDHQNKPLEIKGYSIIRNDLPTGDTHGGVMIYHKDDLAVKHRPDLQIIPNVIAIEISLKRKKVFFIYTYRKHGQSDLQRHDFEDKIDEIIKKPRTRIPTVSC